MIWIWMKLIMTTVSVMLLCVRSYLPGSKAVESTEVRTAYIISIQTQIFFAS